MKLYTTHRHTQHTQHTHTHSYKHTKNAHMICEGWSIWDETCFFVMTNLCFTGERNLIFFLFQHDIIFMKRQHPSFETPLFVTIKWSHKSPKNCWKCLKWRATSNTFIKFSRLTQQCSARELRSGAPLGSKGFILRGKSAQKTQKFARNTGQEAAIPWDWSQHHAIHSSWWSLQQEAACRPHLLLGPSPQMSVQRHHHPHGAATSWLLERSVHHRRVCPCIEPSCRAAARTISHSLSHLVLYQIQRSNDGLVESASPLWLTKAHKPVCMYVWVFMLVYACMYVCVMYTCACIYMYAGSIVWSGMCVWACQCM